MSGDARNADIRTASHPTTFMNQKKISEAAMTNRVGNEKLIGSRNN